MNLNCEVRAIVANTPARHLRLYFSNCIDVLVVLVASHDYAYLLSDVDSSLVFPCLQQCYSRSNFLALYLRVILL